jgi:hypothetical protein
MPRSLACRPGMHVDRTLVCTNEEYTKTGCIYCCIYWVSWATGVHNPDTKALCQMKTRAGCNKNNFSAALSYKKQSTFVYDAWIRKNTSDSIMTLDSSRRTMLCVIV